jgi:hypothetical protein
VEFYSHTYTEIRYIKLTILFSRAVLQLDSDKEQEVGTNVTDKLYELKETEILSASIAVLCENYLNHTEFYGIELTVLLALRIE